MSPANPTAKTYAALNQAFDFFNDRLFGGELPACSEPMAAAEEAE